MSKSHWLVCMALAAGLLISAPTLAQEGLTYYPMLVAGDPAGTPPDSPTGRIIDNTDTGSPFAGVGSVQKNSIIVGTAAPITPWRVLTAAHLFDTNNNGVLDADPGIYSFTLNYGGDLTSVHTAVDVQLNPDFTGFGNPAVNDDLAVVTLELPIPTGVPIYEIWPSVLGTGARLELVGYGKSGYGTSGYTTSASSITKRLGANKMDNRANDDEGSGLYEVWRGDFDGPTSSSNKYGGSSPANLTLGNDVETTLGQGDSGGPGFYYNSGEDQYYMASVNTFIFSFGAAPEPPLFGSGMGGILIHPYLSWINTVLSDPIEAPGDVNGDFFVNSDDLVRILSFWGATDGLRENGDLNGDSLVGADDYVEVLTYWGTIWPAEPAEPVGQLSAIPEPVTLCLLALGLAGMLLRGRSR